MNTTNTGSLWERISHERIREKAVAIATLEAAGATNERREDRHGETRSGWWLDDVFLARDPREAVRLMRGD